MQKKWYCYICGKKLRKSYFLISLDKSVDRVFLVCDENCLEAVDTTDNPITIKIKETR